jgi:DHA2 family multidrug resistance protein
VLQGLAGGGLLAKAQAILFETFPKEEQAMAQAFFGVIVIAGPAIGPTLGGYLVTNVDWRWIFFINAPIGLVAVLMCMSALPTDKAERDTSTVDWLSIFLLAGGLGSLQTVLEEGNSEDWFDSPMISTLSVVALVSLTLFVQRTLASKAPVVDLRVLRHRSLWAGSILSVIVGMALYGTLFSVPIFAQSIMRFTSQETGMLLLPGALASAVAMPIAAKILGKVDARLGLVGGALILATALTMMSGLTVQTGADDFFWPLIVRSFGTVFMFLPLNMATLGPIPKEEVGKAAGFFSLTRQLGGSIGVALLATMLSQRQAFHRGVLVEHLVSSDPLTIERVNALTGGMMARGSTAEEARQRALALLDGIVNQQAAVLSFADTFWATGALIVCFLPLVLLLGKANPKVAVDAGH